MPFVTKDDFTTVFNKFVRKSLTAPSQEYESSAFRQPELYGLPVFVIGYGGRPVTYLGQYIAHKVIKKRENGKTKTRWRILTGFVRILARHVEDETYIELFANGVPSVGIAEWLNNRDKYFLVEDRKELHEIECDESDIINLSGVMNHEDPILLIDITGLLRELPSDIFARYTEMLAIYRSLQSQIFDMEQIIDDLRVELESTKAENRILRSQVHRLNTRIVAVSGALLHYKSELLKTKELMQFYIERLEAVKEGKEKIQAVINDFYDFMNWVSPIIDTVSEKVSQLEKLAEDTERAVDEVKKVYQRVGKNKEVEEEEEEEEGGEE